MSSKEEEIFTACENGTYKFALTQSQKLIKKYPKSTYYQVLYNYVLLQSGKQKEAIESCLKIFNATPNDTKSLELLNSIFNDVGLHNEALQVYENAAKKYPSFEILTKWFHLGVETANYRVLQKSSMALKGLSSQRIFKVWAAFTSYLAAIADDASALEETLFPKLGLKIAESLKPLKDEQEVYVLVKLLQLNDEHQKVVDEILAFSKNDKLDLELQIILLETLDKLEKWEELYQWCKTVLVTYKLDDFDTWKLLVKSSLKLDKDITEIISSYETRNSKLAKVELRVRSGNDIHEAVFDYLKSLGTKNCAFFDIKHYISNIDAEKLLTWLDNQEIPTGEKGLTWEVNVTKFRVLLDNSVLSSPEFISEMVTKYNFYKHLLGTKSKFDFSTSSEIILMIVQSLLVQSFTTAIIITCVVILEGAVLKDEHEFYLRLWLIQLYTLLNCHTQADLHYKSLKIKNVQHDILNQFLVSRLSSTYPTVKTLERSYEIYKSNDRETVYFNKVAFNKGAYNKLQKMLEFQTRLGKSYLKRHLALQALKIGRLLNDKDIGVGYVDDAYEEVEFDNRDLKIFWNFGIDEPLKGLEDKILKNITGSGHNKCIAVQEKINSGDLEGVPEDLDLDDLDEIEKWSLQTIAAVKKVITGAGDVANAMAHYDQVPSVPTDSTWETAHVIFTIIETCKAVHSLFSDVKGMVKGGADLREKNIALLSKLRDDKIIETKMRVSEIIKNHKKAVEASDTVRALGFSSHIDHVFEIVKKGNNESFKLMTLV